MVKKLPGQATYENKCFISFSEINELHLSSTVAWIWAEFERVHY